MCRCGICNHYSPGYQRTLLSDFYYKESADTSSEEKRLSFTAGLCERNAGDGPADGTAVFHHGHRQYGDAVGQ